IVLQDCLVRSTFYDLRDRRGPISAKRYDIQFRFVRATRRVFGEEPVELTVATRPKSELRSGADDQQRRFIRQRSVICANSPPARITSVTRWFRAVQLVAEHRRKAVRAHDHIALDTLAIVECHSRILESGAARASSYRSCRQSVEEDSLKNCTMYAKARCAGHPAQFGEVVFDE